MNIRYIIPLLSLSFFSLIAYSQNAPDNNTSTTANNNSKDNTDKKTRNEDYEGMTKQERKYKGN